MTIGLPSHLAPAAVHRAFVRAGHVVAAVCLTIAFLTVASLQLAGPAQLLWPALLALLPIAGMLALVWRERSRFLSVAFLAIGAAAFYWYALTVMSQLPNATSSDVFALSTVKVALLFVGAPRPGAGEGIAWAAAAWASGGAVSAVAALQTESAIRPDIATLSVFMVLVLANVLLARIRPGVGAIAPTLHRAARDDRVAQVRSRLEDEASALLHDTVLNHLASIAASSPGDVTPSVARAIERDLRLLIGEEWYATRNRAESSGDVGWPVSELHAVLEEVRDEGLVIELGGDLEAIAALPPATARAVALAVKQCLVNVQRHAGTGLAEVSIYSGEDEVAVMVVDDGAGFDPAAASGSKLGLRQSVHQRIRDVGGDVTVWSTPGSGTSVLLRVPLSGARVDG